MAEPGRFTRVVYARIAPNEDLILATEKVALLERVDTAFIRGSLGSLTDSCLELADGRLHPVPGPAVEVLSLTGEVRTDAGGTPRATLAAVVGDREGRVLAGRIVPGRNLVLVTFELALEVWEPDRDGTS